ncbi:MAG: hypothetical protein JKY70_05655 [Mucilaginibacter sp.]|nr:hypothetical protein [Mucilaginibacter sp.]
MESTDYPFGRLDLIIANLANLPLNNRLTTKDSEKLDSAVKAELNQIYFRLKSEIFRRHYLNDSKDIIRAYLTNINYLAVNAQKLMATDWENKQLGKIIRPLLEGLEALRDEISTRFVSVEVNNGNSAKPTSRQVFKILCHLSVDQIGLLLKAADEIQLISARSFSQVLQTIVPYLSTEKMENFSWNSARSSTYKMENIDIGVVLKVLESLAAKIRSYNY